jgi:hypothetical protein
LPVYRNGRVADGLSTAAGSDLDGSSSEEERTFDMVAPEAVITAASKWCDDVVGSRHG